MLKFVNYFANRPLPIIVRSTEEEKECKMNTMGTGYLGSANVSNMGTPCLVWANVVTSPYVALLPDVRTTSAHNFCRNILGDQPWPLPSCLTVAPGGSIVLQSCDVRYCGKRLWYHPDDVHVMCSGTAAKCEFRHLAVSSSLLPPHSFE